MSITMLYTHIQSICIHIIIYVSCYISGVTCGIPPAVSNAGFTVFNLTTVIYACNVGYVMSGNPAVPCHAGGNWGNGPDCTSKSTL